MRDRLVVALMLAGRPALARANQRCYPRMRKCTGWGTSTTSGGHVFVQARLEGQGPFVFALDTGSEATIVSSEVAAKLGLSGGDRAVISAVGGSRITRSDSVRNVEVGTARMSALPVLIGASNAGSNVDGILGCSFFKAFRVTIDYARLLVTFTAP